MPTGYTAKLYEGEDQTFPEFVLSCARAFGALITMRDDAMDAPIPDEFEPSSWYAERVDKARASLAELEAMSLADATRAASAAHNTAVKEWEETAQKCAECKARYEAMLAEVQAWEPPTSEHQGLKDFMVEQLTSSIDFDGSMSHWARPEAKAPSVWLEEEKARARDTLAPRLKSNEEEIERARSRTEWVNALRGSLSAHA